MVDSESAKPRLADDLSGGAVSPGRGAVGQLRAFAAGSPALFLALLGFLVCLPLVLLDQCPGTDTGKFYSAMIREFGDGNPEGAFHPRIAPLMIVVGGMFARLGIEAFTAAKLTSALFFGLTVIPLFRLADLVWGRRTACWASVMYVLCSRLIRYGGAGGLTTGKAFFLTLMVYGLVLTWRRRNWAGTWATGLGAAGLALIRPEGVYFSVLGLLCFPFLALTGSSDRRAWLKVSVAVCVATLCVCPWIAYQIRACGYAVTDTRQIGMISTLYEFAGITPRGRMPLVDEFREGLGDVPGGLIPVDYCSPPTLGNLIEETWKGFYPQYAVFTLIGLCLICHRGHWRKEDSLLFGWTLLHSAFLVICLHILRGSYVQKRYVIAVLPLTLGWAATGLQATVQYARKHWAFLNRARGMEAVVCVCVIALLWDGYGKLHRSPERRLRMRMERECAEWIRTQGRSLVPPDAPRLVSSLKSYHNGRAPILVAARAEIPFLAAADCVWLTEDRAVVSLPRLKDLCRLAGVHFIVWDDALPIYCPDLSDLEALPPGFRLLFDARGLSDRPSAILGVDMNLASVPQGE